MQLLKCCLKAKKLPHTQKKNYRTHKKVPHTNYSVVLMQKIASHAKKKISHTQGPAPDVAPFRQSIKL